MMAMTRFALHWTMLCVFATLTVSIKLLKTRNLCPTPTKTSCQSGSKLNCLYAKRMLVGVLCVRQVASCEDPWKSVCRRPLTLSCQPHPRECVCGCVETRPVKQARNKHRG
uniref:Secreted protein n=1 Tax=Rhipicephalus zambeziensis TaxID=60191 RepID=A0A224YBC3_9ACAR